MPQIDHNMETLLCPHCLCGVDNARCCLGCKRILDRGHWPIQEMLSTDGLIPPTKPDGVYQVKKPFQLPPKEVQLKFKLPFNLNATYYHIGSSLRAGAELRINGSAPLHATILRNRQDDSWWIYNRSSEYGTLLNDTLIHIKKLLPGDIINIVGIKLRFMENRLESCNDSTCGLSLFVNKLSYSVPRRKLPILDKVTFNVAPGEFIGILGPSGCGKSSLVQHIAGLAKDYTGEVYINGQDFSEVKELYRQSTAYLPQSVNESLHGPLTLKEEIECFRLINLAYSSDATEENVSCLKTLGLSDKLDSRINTLSGGEKRRAAIVLALLRNPLLLLLDEPGAGLDPASEGELMNHLKRISEQGRTILCATHVLENIDLFDKILLLSHGRVVYYGTPSDVLNVLDVTDYNRLYQLLLKEDCPNAYSAPPLDTSPIEIPPTHNVSTVKRQILGYFKRTWLNFFNLQTKFTHPALSYLLSLPMWLFVGQPLGLVIGLRIACAGSFRKGSLSFATLCFCAALAVFWIGINNSARELVKERIPLRSLERLNRIPLAPYLSAKIMWCALICFIQTLSFVVFICIFGRISITLFDKTVSDLAIKCLWFVPLFLTCFTGSLIGLVVSAGSRIQTMAVSIVPNLAILALLFSNSVIQFENNKHDYYLKCAESIAKVLPCYWPAKTIESIQDKAKDLTDNFEGLLTFFIIYVIITLLLIPILQRKNERDWSGR